MLGIMITSVCCCHHSVWISSNTSILVERGFIPLWCIRLALRPRERLSFFSTLFLTREQYTSGCMCCYMMTQIRNLGIQIALWKIWHRIPANAKHVIGWDEYRSLNFCRMGYSSCWWTRLPFSKSKLNIILWKIFQGLLIQL